MNISISLNEVLRDFLGQLSYTYKKYIDENSNIKENQISSYNLLKFFPLFNSEIELNEFIYREAALEIFGHADQLKDNLMNQFNYFIMDMNDEGEHVVEIVSREVDTSIPSTFFFLSKTGCRATRFRFEKTFIEQWNGVDVLVTADPIALENKPEGKISVKVNASYNVNSPADFQIDSILDFIKDETLRNKILNTKITTYEEIS